MRQGGTPLASVVTGDKSRERIIDMEAAAAAADTREAAASLGGQYEKLLATVGNLQGDLQRTVGVCQVPPEKRILTILYCTVMCNFQNIQAAPPDGAW